MFLNPYIAGNPIGGQAGFFGRDDILREVTQVLRNPSSNAIVLYGQRRIGKTSTLLQLERQLHALPDYAPVYFDLQDKAGKPLDAVLYELAQRICAVTGQALADRDAFDPQGTFFRDVFMPQAAKATANGSLVLLFDEFDVLDSPKKVQAGNAFFPYLRAWMGKEKGVQFVFVIGRRPEDLSINTISTFKGVRATRVSLLNEADAAAVVRQSQTAGSLIWLDEVVEQVWHWAQGHPYFTQLLCSVVWENAYEDDPDEAPLIRVDDVDSAVDEALKQGANAFVWIWDGLPPAERVVISAMAEAKSLIITHDDLVGILNQSGVRLIVHQLKLAPETLVEWELLQPANGGYRFSVRMLRYWVQKNRPLRRAKEELDLLDPQAEALFQTGQRFHQAGQVDIARNQLRLALQSNPNHLKAQLLLGQILLEQEQLDEAAQVLEAAYLYDAVTAEADLIKVLLAVASKQEEAAQLKTYQRILEIQPGQPVAQSRQDAILTAQRKRQVSAQVRTAIQYEREEKWLEATKIYGQLLAEFPDEADCQDRRIKAQQEVELQQKYNEALGTIETDNLQQAQRLLADVIYRRPDYKEAARYLLQATNDIDAKEVQAKNQQLRARIDKLEGDAEQSTVTIENLQEETQQLQTRIQELEAHIVYEPQVAPPTSLDTPRQLSAVNPLDYLRLLWWVLMMPQKLKPYKVNRNGGLVDVGSIGNWLTSTLTWTPFFILTTAAGLGTVPLTTDAWSQTIYLWISGGLLLVWFLIGWFSNKEDLAEVAFGVAFVVAFVVAVGVVVGVAGGVAFGVAGGVAFVVAFGVAGIVAFGVAVVVAGIVAVGVAVGVAVVVAGIVAFGVAVGVAGGVAFVVAFVVAFGVAGGVAGGVADVVEASIKSEKASWLGRGGGAALVVSYLFLVWFAFLGGAAVLAGS